MLGWNELPSSLVHPQGGGSPSCKWLGFIHSTLNSHHSTPLIGHPITVLSSAFQPPQGVQDEEAQQRNADRDEVAADGHGDADGSGANREAAVVSPRAASRSGSRKMVPAPRKETPVAMAAMM